MSFELKMLQNNALHLVIIPGSNWLSRSGCRKRAPTHPATLVDYLLRTNVTSKLSFGGVMPRRIGNTWLVVLACCLFGSSCTSAPVTPVTQSTAPTSTVELVPTATVSDATPSATVASAAATPSDTVASAAATPTDTVAAAPSPSSTVAVPSATASPAAPPTSVPTAGLGSTATTVPAPTTRPILTATTAPLATNTPAQVATSTSAPTESPTSPTPVPTLTSAPTATPTPAPVLSAKPTGGGTLAGVVTDTAGRPIAGAFVTVGFKTFKLVGQSDGSGHYVVTGIPNTPGVEVFSFAPGYTYDHSGGFPIPSGRVTGFNVKLARDVNPALDPVFSSPGVNAGSVARGGSVTLSVAVQSSQVMSDEVIAASGQLGRSALFVPVGGGRYQATFFVPTDIPAGAYSFSLFGATEQCEENARFPTVQVAVT